jgi:hypothetical protein
MIPQNIWGHCNHCQTYILYCPRCGNPTCNGGSGTSKLGDYGKLATHQLRCPECEVTHSVWVSNGYSIPTGKEAVSYKEAMKLVRNNYKYFKGIEG